MKDGDKLALDDILSSRVNGDDIGWDGAQCFYKDIEIIKIFGTDSSIAVWVRNAMPDGRNNLLRIEDPGFFEQFDKAVDYAKEIVNEVIKTDWALGSYGKPYTGRVG